MEDSDDNADRKSLWASILRFDDMSVQTVGSEHHPDCDTILWIRRDGRLWKVRVPDTAIDDDAQSDLRKSDRTEWVLAHRDRIAAAARRKINAGAVEPGRTVVVETDDLNPGPIGLLTA